MKITVTVEVDIDVEAFADWKGIDGTDSDAVRTEVANDAHDQLLEWYEGMDVLITE